eukprot:753144-Hanusia_phi.AAC.4
MRGGVGAGASLVGGGLGMGREWGVMMLSGLFNAEPANFAVVNFLRSRLVEEICKRYIENSDGSQEPLPDKTEQSVQEQLVAVFCHLFSVVRIPQWHVEYLTQKPAKKGPCQ